MPEAPSPQSNELNALSARIRMNEERDSELSKKVTMIEQNMLANQKRAMSEIKLIHDDLLELKRSIQVIQDRIITIIKELKLTPRKEDLDVLRKYVELWDPIRFVTRETVEKVVEEKMQPKVKEEE